MAVIRHVVEVVGGTVRQDLWCEDCHTSGRFEVDMHAIGGRGMQMIGTVRQCVRCDYTDPPPEGP